MAASPKYKVYTADNEYIASVKYPDIAGALVSVLGEGSTIRIEHKRIVWTEGKEAQPAGESYDFVAEVVYARE